jgi:hypothetical protein
MNILLCSQGYVMDYQKNEVILFNDLSKKKENLIQVRD